MHWNICIIFRNIMYVLIHMYSKLQLVEKRPQIWKEWERTNTRVCVKEKKTMKANKLESHKHTHTKKKKEPRDTDHYTHHLASTHRSKWDLRSLVSSSNTLSIDCHGSSFSCSSHVGMLTNTVFCVYSQF